MADFKIAHARTSIFEGGYTNDPDDNGNWTGEKKGSGILVGTNYGITAGVLMHYLGRIPTAAEMKNLSKEVAENIYKENYWDPIRGDELLHQEEANNLYDSAVNMGVGTAIILAHRAANLPERSFMSNALINTLNHLS